MLCPSDEIRRFVLTEEQSYVRKTRGCGRARIPLFGVRSSPKHNEKRMPVTEEPLQFSQLSADYMKCKLMQGFNLLQLFHRRCSFPIVGKFVMFA